jgi:hypothetical protein
MTTADERRTEQRKRTLRAARIVYGDFRYTLDCVVRDRTDSGARLRCENHSDAPNDFYVFDSGNLQRAEVAWRRGNEIGIRFVAPAISVHESSDPRHARFKFML